MKKFRKGIFIAAATLGVVGIGLTAAGAAMGGGTEETFREMERRFGGTFGGHGIWRLADDDFWDDDDYERDAHQKRERIHRTETAGVPEAEDKGNASAAAQAGRTDEIATPDQNAASGEKTESDITAERTPDPSDVNAETDIYYFAVKDNLEFDLSYDELILEEQDAREITVEISGDSDHNVRIEEEKNSLEITSSRKLKTNRTVKVSYPKDTSFREVEINLGAGRMELRSSLTADSLDIGLGAGEVVNSGIITATEVDLEVGTGSMKLGSVDAKKIEGECGMGEMHLSIAGSQPTYSYSLECGIGEIRIGKDSYSGLGREKEIRNPGTERTVDLECGIGEITVEFLAS